MYNPIANGPGTRTLRIDAIAGECLEPIILGIGISLDR